MIKEPRVNENKRLKVNETPKIENVVNEEKLKEDLFETKSISAGEKVLLYSSQSESEYDLPL